MSRPLDLELKFKPDPVGETEARQKAASAPECSAWVMANAGSGKTHILTRRVVRLLMAGVNPATILCLTFTRAAAAEMSTRIFGLLGSWATCTDDDLANQILALTGRAPSADEIADARLLFGQALQIPGGLRIQTIHGFCERLLHQFPFEAGAPGQLEILDEYSAAALMDNARNRVLDRARNAGDPLRAAAQLMATTEPDMAIDAALADLVRRRDFYTNWINQAAAANPARPFDRLITDLAQRLDLDPEDDENTIAENFLNHAQLQIMECRAQLEAALRRNPGTRNDGSTALLDAIGNAETAYGRAEATIRFYFSETGKPYAPGSRATKSVQAEIPDFENHFAADIGQCLDYIEKRNALETYRFTEALLRIGDAMLREYDDLKEVAGNLDYDDLIIKTRDLLTHADAAQWVRYKLDAGFAHLLVDEAQDTNPTQWAIIEALTDEFFAGLSGNPADRTIFAVGDEKQSIFGFQGSDPNMLADMRTRYADLARDSGRQFIETPLATSFRSAQEILDAVDRTFQGDLKCHIASSGYEPHSASRMDEPGRVIIWDRLVRAPDNPPERWTAAYDAPTRADAELARRIGAEIQRLLTDADALPSGKRVAPGEILILVRKRDAFTTAMNRELKRLGLPSAGSDRIALKEHIIVQDLLALGDISLLPEDDLQLAAVLKSPLLGLDDNDLMFLAAERGEATLWSRLADSDNQKHTEAAKILQQWQSLSSRCAPFEFYSHILAVGGGRAAFRAHFRNEADDVLDLFLSEILAFEAAAPATLQGLLAHIRNGSGDVKREVDERAQAVRVMTVHGAKGLEADTVFLVDTGGLIIHSSHRDPLLVLPGDTPGDPDALIWRRRKPRATRQQFAAEKAEEIAIRGEYYRLLYVAMTRARDQLYVCGIRGPKTPPDCWYGCVSNALLPVDIPRSAEGELIAPYSWPAAPRAVIPPKPAARTEKMTEDAPDWLWRPAPPGDMVSDASASYELAKTAGGSANRRSKQIDDASAAPTTGESIEAAKRGILIHMLLEKLPEVEADRQMAVAMQLLADRVKDASHRAQLAEEAMKVMSDPETSGFFGPGSRSEISLSGHLTRNGSLIAVAARVDRLLVEAGAIRIVDFKTGGDVPASYREVPIEYIGQLAIYRRLAALVDPTRNVTASVIYTRGPKLIPLPDLILEDSLKSMGVNAPSGA